MRVDRKKFLPPASDWIKTRYTKKLGCGLDDVDTEQIGIYLPEYDAYFREESDVNYIEYIAADNYGSFIPIYLRPAHVSRNDFSGR